VKVLNWIRASVIEAFSFPLYMTLSLCSSREKECYSKKGSQPILLVHGYCHDSSAWFYLKRRLKNAGLGPIYSLNLGHPLSSIRDHAKQVQSYAEEIRRKTGFKHLTLIGHSMGGLVSSYYATHMARKGIVSDLITIGSPLAGTRMARLGWGPSAREMQPGSSFLTELQQSMAECTATRFYHIGSSVDWLIIPAESAFPKTTPGHRRCAFDNIGHLTLLYSPRVASQLIAWMQESF
jgi:triacylglycerol lipase